MCPGLVKRPVQQMPFLDSVCPKTLDADETFRLLRPAFCGLQLFLLTVADAREDVFPTGDCHFTLPGCVALGTVQQTILTGIFVLAAVPGVE